MTDPKNHPKKQANTDTTAERPPVDYSAITDEALRKKLTDPETLAMAAELAPYGVDLLAALADPSDELPSVSIISGAQMAAMLASANPSHIRTASISTLYGWKPGETLGEAIRRKKREEAERAGSFVENALSEQAAAKSSDEQTQTFTSEGESLFDAIEYKKSKED